MDPTKIKILRSRTAIPLDVAIQLLKENNGDIDASEQAFHHNKIRAIVFEAECDYETAKEYYELCKYDTTKAIERINNRTVRISTREKPTSRNEIGFSIWPVDHERHYYKTKKRNDVFIPAYDFDFILDEFNSVFPIQNPWNKQVETALYIYGHNYFDNATCRILSDRIAQSKTDDPKVLEFKMQFIAWLNDKLNYATYIVVFGNL
ncbi:MAG: hypothetical protein E2604_06315 [Flavobacterium sp.]|jgi:hypothetical protein|nr:hypothetical protein [Flavobacterium sp.]